MSTRQRDNETTDFITLNRTSLGFVCYGVGPGAREITFRGEPLTDFLEKLTTKIGELKTDLSARWRQIDRTNPNNTRNDPIINKFLHTASWAYSLARELQPLQKACTDGMGNPLRELYLVHLGEIFTNCFCAVHMYGNAGKAMIARKSLLKDFEENGGINERTGGPGHNLSFTLFLYFFGYFGPVTHEPIAYVKYADLLYDIGHMIKEKYPLVAGPFAKEIRDRLTNTYQGFGKKSVTSEPKTLLMTRLTDLVTHMEEVAARNRKAA